MRTIIGCADGYDVVGFSMDRYCFVTGKIPKQALKEGFVSVSDEDDGKSRKVFANTNLVMVVKHLHRSGNGCRDITFIRQDRYNDTKLDFAGPCHLPEDELKRIVPLLRGSNAIRYQTLEGFAGAVVYPDEVAIPDPSSPNGVTGWIVLKSEYKQMLATGEIPKTAIAETAATKPVIDPVAEASARAAKALDELKAAQQAVADALANEAATKRAAAEAARVIANKTAIEAAEAEIAAKTARKVANDKKAAAKVAAEAADAAEEAAAEAEAKVSTPAA